MLVRIEKIITQNEEVRKVNKEKIIQIYEVMSDITLAHLNKIKETDTTLDDGDIGMISATLQLYNAIADCQQPELFPR